MQGLALRSLRVDVSGKVEQLFFGGDENCLVDTLIKGSDAVVFAVEIHGVSGAEGIGEFSD